MTTVSLKNGPICRCCGGTLLDGKEGPLWCERCVCHVSHDRSKTAYERTYLALNGNGCPYGQQS